MNCIFARIEINEILRFVVLRVVSFVTELVRILRDDVWLVLVRRFIAESFYVHLKI